VSGGCAAAEAPAAAPPPTQAVTRPGLPDTEVMSLFIADLAWDNESLIAYAKIGVLEASLISGVIGFIILSRALPKKTRS
jgi:hypothetical protein